MLFRSKNPERVERVMNLWKQGVTSNAIAANLGISRNSVIGIVNRARAAGDERAVIRCPENSRSGGLRAMWLANEAKRREAKLAAQTERKEAAQAARLASIEGRREAARIRMAEALAIKTQVDEEVAAMLNTSEVQVQHHREVEALEQAAVVAAIAYREEERIERLRTTERIRRARDEAANVTRLFAQGTVFKPRATGLCQWIMDGSPLSPAEDVQWCGAAAMKPGCSWCAAHYERVFAKPRQPGAAQSQEAAA